MKIFFLTIIAVFLLLNKGFGQNLVPNGDFELGPLSSSEGWMFKLDNTCSSLEILFGPDFWVVLDDSPDRLIDTDIHCDFDITNAQSGNAFINLIYQEAGKVTLTQPIKKDSTYKLGAYLMLNTFNGLSSQSNRFCIKFSNTNDSIFSPYVSSNMWTYFDTIFIAKSDASEIEVWVKDFVQSGLYIDNIQLTRINSVFLNEKFDSKFNIYPNPTNEFLNIDLSTLNQDKIEFRILDLMGKTVYIDTIHSQHSTFDIKNLSLGIYSISLDNQIVKQLIISP